VYENPDITNPLQKDHPDSRIPKYGRKWLLAYKSCNISETVQEQKLLFRDIKIETITPAVA